MKALKPGCKNPRDHIEFVADRPFNDVRYYISSEKLMKLGWKEEVCRAAAFSQLRSNTLPLDALDLSIVIRTSLTRLSQ